MLGGGCRWSRSRPAPASRPITSVTRTPAFHTCSGAVSTPRSTATTGGCLFHAVRNTGDGSWTRFEDVEASADGALAPIDTAAAIAGGRRHLVVPAEDGELWHSIRSDTGVWTPFGNVEDFAGEVGSVRRVAAAGIGGDLHVVAVTVLGDVLHTIRRPDGTWTPLHSVEDFAGAVSGVEDVAAAAMPDGTLQVVLSLGDGRSLHSLRAPSGSWIAWGDVEAFAGDPRTPESISAVECAVSTRFTYRRTRRTRSIRPYRWMTTSLR